MPLDPIAIALVVVDALEAEGVPCVIGGSFASSIHGIARATQDIDIVADLDLDRVERLVAGLADRFYVDADAARRAVLGRGSFNLIHREEMYKIDVFVPPPTPLARQQLVRRQLELVVEPARRAFVLSPEDTVLQKLDRYRGGGEASERQWRDVLGVLKVQQGRLDLALLRSAAAGAGLLDLLERAFLDSRAPLS